MADPLSPADRGSLQAERGPVNMAVAGALVFEAGPGLAYDRVAERVGERLHLVPRYRQRLEQPPLGLANPVWVDDTGFDVHWHLRSARLPAPGGREQLDAFVAREMSRRLDRSRPLWELHVVDGVADDRVALVPKMHHALVDGLAAVGIGMVLLDPTPEPMQLPEGPEWRPRGYDMRRHFARLAARPLTLGLELAVDSTLKAFDATAAPMKAADDLRRATDLVVELARQRPSAPMTPLNRPISPNRRYATVAWPLAALKAAGRAGGGTVNDAVLAAVCGMLDRYFAAAGFTPAGGGRPVALVPVSVRNDDESGDTGNRISTVFVDLPVDEPSPAGRIGALAATTRALKESAAVRAGALLVGATGQAPPLLSSVLVRAMGEVRAFNLVVSNIPGPQQPFYLNGARLREVYPAVPLNPPNQGLTVGVLSYDGNVFFGLLADAALEPGVAVARDALAAALAELA